MLHLVTIILLVLAALVVLAAIIAGIVLVVRHFSEARSQKIMSQIYLPMIKDQKVCKMIEGYESKDQRILALSYLCFGTKGAMPHNEAEEQLAELASSLEFAAEDDITQYVDSILAALNRYRLSVRFNWKKEFRYRMKVTE